MIVRIAAVLTIVLCIALWAGSEASASDLNERTNTCLRVTEMAGSAQAIRISGFSHKEYNQIVLIRTDNDIETQNKLAVGKMVYRDWKPSDSIKKVKKEFFMKCLERNL